MKENERKIIKDRVTLSTIEFILAMKLGTREITKSAI